MNYINELHQQFPYYGYRKIHWCLMHQYGYKLNIKKTQRLIQEMGIRAIFPGPKTSIPSRDGSVFPYLLQGVAITRVNQVWGVDITYIKLPVGTVYLFALIDWYSRFIVSYKLVNTITGILWISKLNEYSIKISHDGVGRCIDNIQIERFWRTIKYEDIFIQAYETLVSAREGIRKFIEHYNYHRPHQALGYRTPSQVFFSC